MGYKIVAVNPLKLFPLLSFGLANVVGLDDAKKQIEKKFTEAGLTEIKANAAVQELDAKIREASVELVNLTSRHDDLVQEEVEKIKKEIEELENARKSIAGPIREKHELAGKEEISKLEARWADGKIEPALKLHLAHQERRLAHFNASCHFFGCDNPRRQKRGGGTGTKANRPGAKPLFCGVHVGLRKCLTKEAFDTLRASSAKRVAIA